MTVSMRRVVLLLSVILAAPMLCGASSAVNHGSQNVVADIPLHRSVFVDCAHGGAGDTVTLDGRLHTLFTTVTNATGGTLVHQSFTPMGVSGVGETGDVYRGVGTTSTLDAVSTRTEETMLNVFLMVGRGPGNNLVIHTLLHFGLNGSGVTNPLVDTVTITCA
jgi:hypothetical protein